VTRIWLSGEPRPAPRPRANGGRRAFNPKWYTELKERWAEEAAGQLIGAPHFMNGERLVVRLDFFRKDFTLADWDNLAKAATDPLSGLWFRDDAMIDEAHVTVRRGVGKARAGVAVCVDVRRRQRAPGMRRELEIVRARRLRAGRV
jgi:Holliday junction resolvase RusA-like endonuclease